ncbi:MAG: ribulose-phosphate 3-epimerase [Candidatus Marinimicrobia bacterium]|jgi:ribulose-phosphate 3-epimerase|nr:ribulose-phosphate 3-epimerase [Candidatus Neomarinimicrobiota bacterium]MBT3576655.1 ribulose-phosphate 3-epimerase [Candidatus Neomarinimicrobiota bacterium]MBT3678911.1 ribulose-phosphate 3-epimerase [Candidatus Neomarinimicrobiota bacterium]MBT3952256.1 ribulose-phosphate 3-epimerase [Candidatus Neomarinimicrobiota bacterium]MBT4252917.1 ribulose-phosphate 3-epimerase [Candidatus Neomarinimicrobiota bacterium]
MQAQISPSVLSADFSRLGDQIQSVADSGGEVLHLDVMDGHFVPNLTFGPLLVKAMRKMTDMILEAHLMISEPDLYIENFIKAGADIILVHPTTCSSVQGTLKNIKSLGAQAGLVVNPDEKLSIVEPYLGEMDQLLIMSVVPGFGGQSFMPEVLDDLPTMRQALIDNNVLVEIDGGINKSTIGSVLNKGISRFVAGSAVFNGHGSPGDNFNTLQTLVTAGK